MIQLRATACIGLSFLFAVAIRPLAAAPALPSINTNNIITITNAPYNAVGDGVFTNTTAIQQAISAASTGGGGLVRIPAPGTFLCGPLTLANNVGLQIDGGAKLLMLPLGKYPGGVTSPANFIQASSLHDVMITGSGTIDGQGLPWWQAVETNSAINRPNMMTFSTCTRVLIENVTMSNSPSPFMSIKGKAGNVTIRGVTVLAPSSGAIPPSHNTDAIDLAETNALIQDCYISTGDDNLAVGSSASVSTDIIMTNCFLGAGHGVSIGSYTSDGVSNLTVINCNFSGTDNGIRLKSQRDRGGLIQNLNYLNLGMTNVQWPFLIYSYYEFGLGTLTGVTPLFAATNSGVGAKNPIWRNITFSNITATTGSSTRPPLMIWGMPEIPVSNVTFTAINLTSSSTRSPEILNADGIRFIDSHFNLSGVGNTFQLYNAHITVSNSLPTPDVLRFDGLVTNGVANAFLLDDTKVSVSNTNAIDAAPLVLDGTTLTVSGRLDASRFASMKLALGTNATTIAATSDLVVGGTVDIGAGAGFTSGTYTVFSYGGNLTWNSPSLGMVPPEAQLSWDTNTIGKVKLVAVLPPSLVPPNVSYQMTGGQLQVGWPADHIGWTLQIQTNGPDEGLGTNWIPVAGSTTSNQFNLPVDPNNSSVFLRLTYP